MKALSPTETQYYARQISLSDVGLKGQLKLKNARVLVVGAGGLGCPVLLYLSGAGVGYIGIVDHDQISMSNLHRQILYSTNDIGANKAEQAKVKLQVLNPNITIKSHPFALNKENAIPLFENYDIIVDATDNFATRYLICDASIICKKPLVFGAIHGFEGQLSVFNYKNGPSYRCLFPEWKKDAPISNCAENGVLGVLPGIVGCYQANEVLKIILKIGQPLSGKVLILNTLKNTQYLIDLTKNQSLIDQIDLSFMLSQNYSMECSTLHQEYINEIDPKTLKIQLKTPKKFIFLDVREKNETPKPKELNGLNIPIGEVETRIFELDQYAPMVVYCQSGIRSAKVVNTLQKKYGFNNLLNLQGGINNW